MRCDLIPGRPAIEGSSRAACTHYGTQAAGWRLLWKVLSLEEDEREIPYGREIGEGKGGFMTG